MGATHLSKRKNWQMGASITGRRGENDFAANMALKLPSHYEVVRKPKKIVIYSEGKGIVLDCKIINHETGKSVLVENKRGDKGGNVHERVYKYLAPELKKRVRAADPSLIDQPFYLVFSGKTFQGQKYKDELAVTLAEENYDIIKSSYNRVAANIVELLD